MFLRDHINRGRIGKLTEFVYFFSNSNSPSLGSPASFCLYSSVLTELGRTLTSCLFTEVPHQGHPLGTYSPSTCNEGASSLPLNPHHDNGTFVKALIFALEHAVCLVSADLLAVHFELVFWKTITPVTGKMAWYEECPGFVLLLWKNSDKKAT